MALVDVRTDMKLSHFDGADERWTDWCLTFESYTALLGFEHWMVMAAEQA